MNLLNIMLNLAMMYSILSMYFINTPVSKVILIAFVPVTVIGTITDYYKVNEYAFVVLLCIFIPYMGYIYL